MRDSHPFNVIACDWLEAPAAATIERVTVDWLRQFCGLPEGAGGLFTSGGSMANLTAMAAARHVMLDDRIEGAVVYRSAQAHGSNRKALRVLGFGDDQVRDVEVDDGLRLDVDALEAAIAADRAAGLRPFSVIATAGTTNTGAVDPLDAIADLCTREGLWLHVDGAYGAPAVLTERGSRALAGLGRAHSIAIDPHKWLFQPFEIGCVIVREAHWLPRTFGLAQEYMQDTVGGEINYGDHGFQLTRSFRALKLWMTIKVHGMAAIRAAIDRCIDIAEEAEALLRASGAFDIVTPAQLGIVTFSYRLDGSDPDAVNKAIVEALIDDGYAMLSSTRLGGRTVLRLCTINPRTTTQDLESTIALLARLGAQAVAADG